MVHPSPYGVDEDVRRQFEADWAESRPRPIADYLASVVGPAYRATLEELVLIELEFTWQRWSRRCRTLPAAETVPRPPLVETYLARFPQLDQAEVLLRLVRQEYAMRLISGDPVAVPEYQQRFSQLSLSEALLNTDLLSQLEEETVVHRRSPAPIREPPLPRPFGHFELLSEIGRGGMGVVYRARQVAAQRDVALKVISPSRLAEVPAAKQREIVQRFQTEARAAARLQHDHLVAVYEVGEIDGQPYYAMRYVAGHDLADLVRDGPLENRRAAAYLEAVAGAIQAAHQAGILHRDLKPQNVLIDAATDQPLVTDFGLAKFLETEGGPTTTGEVLGTPSFMAPEQIHNTGGAGPLADVYSLGATLYFAVTGRPPFQAATPVDTIFQVCQAEPLAPRQLNPSVDRDLNTICLRCLQKAPARRYSSAQELADDLRRYREGRPILARPVSRAERLLRWSRRNPWAAALGTVSALLAMLMVVVATAGHAATVRERDKFEESYQQARRAVDDLYIDVSENTLLHRPGMHELRNTLLRRALGYYQWFLARRADDRTAGEELAATYFRVGLITAQIESTEQALAYYEQARTLQQQLCDEQPRQVVRQAALGDTLNALGTVRQQLRQWDQSQATFEQALALREQVAAADGEHTEPQRKLANTLMNLGIVQRSRGNFAEALRRVREAQDRRRALLPEPIPAVPDVATRVVQRDLAKGEYTLATLALAQEQPDQAVAPLEAAIAGFSQLAEQQPDDFEIRALLAQCHRLLGDVRQEAEQWEQAEHHYRLALDEAELLARENPRVVDFQHAWAALWLSLGGLQARRTPPDDALHSFSQARDLLQPLAMAKPSYRRDLATALRELALLRLQRQEIDAARELLVAACQHLRELMNQYPLDPDYSAELRLAEELLASRTPR